MYRPRNVSFFAKPCWFFQASNSVYRMQSFIRSLRSNDLAASRYFRSWTRLFTCSTFTLVDGEAFWRTNYIFLHRTRELRYFGGDSAQIGTSLVKSLHPWRLETSKARSVVHALSYQVWGGVVRRAGQFFGFWEVSPSPSSHCSHLATNWLLCRPANPYITASLILDMWLAPSSSSTYDTSCRGLIFHFLRHRHDWHCRFALLKLKFPRDQHFLHLHSLGCMCFPPCLRWSAMHWVRTTRPKLTLRVLKSDPSTRLSEIDLSFNRILTNSFWFPCNGFWKCISSLQLP